MSCQIAVLGNAQLFTACVEDGVECAVNDALGADVHPAARCHLSVVGNAHLLGDFPVVQIVIHTDHHGVGDDDPGSFRLGREQSQRMSGFHDQGLLICHDLKILLDQSVLKPVLADLSGLTVGYQLIRIQSYFEVQVVVDHDLKSLARQAVALVLVDWFAIEAAFRTISVSIDSAVGLQFFHEFRRQCLMQFFRNIPESVLQSDLCLCLGQTEASVRRTPDAFLELRIFGQLVAQFDGHRVRDRCVIQHVCNPLFYTRFTSV